MTDAVEVKGLGQLARALREFDADMPAKLKAAAKEVAEPVAFLARQLAPHRTGDLGRSIRTGATQRSATIKAGGRRVPYAGPIHFGWRRRHISPHPFLYEALDRRTPLVVETMTEALETLIAQTDWPHERGDA